jgi:uncharacterized protein YggE
MRRLVFALLASLPAAAVAQTPVVVATPPNNITVEAQEVVRQKPDAVKLYMKVEVRNAEASQAADEAADEAKKMADGLNKLKLTGVTVNTPQQRVVRTEVIPNRGGGGNVPGVVEYRVIRPVQVVVAESDPDKFTAAVEKVQVEAFKLGLVPDLASDNLTYNPGGQEKNSPIRAVYSRKGGWEELTGPALERATKKARTKAEALAAGAGVKLGDVLSVSEVPTYPNSPGYNPYGGSGLAASGEPEDEYADGELSRKVRVRVVFATK